MTPDTRCCGDHPNEWDTEAEPGTGFCAACHQRLRGGGGGVMDAERRAEGRRLLAAAMPAPWSEDGVCIIDSERYPVVVMFGVSHQDQRQVALIVWMRNNLADLLDALDAADADAERLAQLVLLIPQGGKGWITGQVEIEAAEALAAHRARTEGDQ